MVGGNETEKDPYIISGWIINIPKMVNGVTGIMITSTSEYFIIKDCYSLGKKELFGIMLNYLRNAKTENVKIECANSGIYNQISTIQSIKNCAISNCSKVGIYNEATINSIKNYTVSNCESGIFNGFGSIKFTTNCIILGCKHGINTCYSDSSIFITNCMFLNCEENFPKNGSVQYITNYNLEYNKEYGLFNNEHTNILYKPINW